MLFWITLHFILHKANTESESESICMTSHIFSALVMLLDRRIPSGQTSGLNVSACGFAFEFSMLFRFTGSSADCPEGFVFRAASCYYFNSPSDKRTHAEAEQFCKEKHK